MLRAVHPELSVLKIDCKNAFNTLTSWLVRKVTKAVCPNAFPFVEAMYGVPAKFFVIDPGVSTSPLKLNSEEGVQQGDPLGSALFSLAVNPVVEKTIGMRR
jgi:hypothetical protein